MKIVISQPMFFPWIGLFEQLKLADVFIYYDDVQYPTSSSFINRVQIKTMQNDTSWLSLPVKKHPTYSKILEVNIAPSDIWLKTHEGLLNHAFMKTKYKNDVFDLYLKVVSKNFKDISSFNIFAFEEIAKYFNIINQKRIYRSSELNIQGKSSQRLLEICKYFGASEYITGWGAKNYIDYKIFEEEKIKICYMDYNKTEYPQKFGSFTPYVSILDLIANCGQDGSKYINSQAQYWKDTNEGDQNGSRQ